jgi:dienelactone hydrolase
MGRSNGGTTALMLATSSPATAHTYKFAHSFAVSPACDALERFAFTMPVTIFTGDRDQANNPALCRIIDGQNGMVKLVLFNGTHHGFEDRTPAYVFNGWRHVHNPKADKATMDKALEIVMSDGARSGSQPK